MANTDPLIPRSAVPGILWPAIPAPAGAAMLAMQFQLEKSQWWPAERLAREQFRQLENLLSHAYETVPFYRKRLSASGYDPRAVSPEWFSRLPLLRREEVQSQRDELISRRVPPDHGKLIEHRTSGSTGRPIETVTTQVGQFFWYVLTLRDHLWHRRDLSGKLAAIRTTVRDGTAQGWGPSTDAAFDPGPCATLNIRADIGHQLKWLQQQQPAYLLSHPSNIHALAQRALADRIPLPGLREVRTFGESVSPELRAACRAAWGVPVTDAYSAEEAGYIALQCPDHEHYHVQSEDLLVEILNESGRPCVPGEIGKVVITTLHNFAMPLIRYEIRDYAEVGEPCSCGRGLPVLKRLMGRRRNLVTLPDGTRHWPSFPEERWGRIAPIRQIQLVQREPDRILARLVTDRPLSAEEQRQLTAVLQDCLGYPFRIDLHYLEEIPRGANFKYEDFVSELPEG